MGRKGIDLHGAVVAITGGGRGIGAAIALRLVEAGARVSIGDIDADLVAATAAELGCHGGVVDVTDEESFQAYLDEVEATVGPLDVVINNAGVMPTGPLLTMDPELIRRNFDIDLLAVVTGSRLAAVRMVGRGHGTIINIASVAGRLAMPGLAVYNGAKAGVLLFSEALDAELSPSGVRVCTVSPTFTRTGLISGIATNKFIQTIGPDEVADRVVRTIERPKLHTIVPGSLAWANAFALIPLRIKRGLQRTTGSGRIFLDNSDERKSYLDRIAR